MSAGLIFVLLVVTAVLVTLAVRRVSGHPSTFRVLRLVEPGAGEPAPMSARAACWITEGILALTTLAVIVLLLLVGDSYDAGFIVGYVGGPIIVIAWGIAAALGIVGLVQSIGQHSRRGIWLSLMPYAVVLVIVVLFRL